MKIKSKYGSYAGKFEPKSRPTRNPEQSPDKLATSGRYSRHSQSLTRADLGFSRERNKRATIMGTETTGSAGRRRGTMSDFRQIGLARLGLARNASQESFTMLLRDVRNTSSRSHSLEDAARYLRLGGRLGSRGSSFLGSDSFGSGLPTVVDRVSNRKTS